MGTGNRQIHATAYHEAGHVVIGLEVGFRLGKRGVSVIPDNESSGRVHMPSFDGDPEVDNTDQMLRKIERRAIFLLAGMEAQRKFKLRSVRGYHGHSDYLNAVNLLGCVEPAPELSSAHIKYLILRTRNMLDRPVVWARVVPVAEALVSRKQLGKKEVQALIDDAYKTA